jgi:hypothetical protein
MTEFERIFREEQDAMGLHHYWVTFEAATLEPEFADIAPDPVRCFAHCRYDPVWLEKNGKTEQAAVHEVCHLLLADLVHACGQGQRIAEWEEERAAVRVERIVMRARRTLTLSVGHDSASCFFPGCPHPHCRGGHGDELRRDQLR